MQIIISPTKQMQVDTDTFLPQGLPRYLPEAQTLLRRLQSLDYAQAKALWQCSDKLAQPNFARLQTMALTQQLTPAILAFVGIQYRYMAPDLFTAPALAYIQAYLRILSGFYGSLRPFDGIVPYRLELGARLAVAQAPDLYAFWGDTLYASLDWSQPVLNLASQEYAKAITPYLQPQDRLITVVFGQYVNGKIKTRATLAKMARGQMVRYLAENNVTTLTGVTRFDHPDYRFAPDLSHPDRLVFLHQ
ncbi:peroxide stress protein YaaA [Lacticaseibacillus baoqingensis]|uniref:UPF0246 protein ACFQ5J_01090 n=1 Tax=Lacticaseibacillus baoqingensis TaxID=2486013 RepID=A0ABW4E3F6_9LACO|nr:peroxide stress protein YaaA [Lacticaseibacillus baoqingensis]